MRKLLYIPVIGVAIGEFLILYDRILEGMGMHIISLLAIILIITFDNLPYDIKNILQSLMLLPLLRIINLSIPRLFADAYWQYVLICIVAVIPICSVIKNQYTSFGKLETSVEMSHVYILIVIFMWSIIIMIGQYVNIVSNVTFSPESVYVREEFISVFLIISFSILLLTFETKYWNKYISNIFGMCNTSLLLTFVTIVTHKVMVGL
jgi:hypothetical protein